MEWLTIAEASQRYAKSMAAIRRLLDKSNIETKKDERGRVLLLNEQLTHYIVATTKSHTTVKPAISNNDDLIVELRRTCDDLRRMLSEEKARSDRIEKRNEALQSEILKLTKEMQGILQKQSGVLGWLRAGK